MKRSLRILCSLGASVCLFALGCASPQRTATSVNAPDPAPLQPGERVTVEFRYVDAPPLVYQIDARGFIALGDQAVEVAGLSPAEAAARIRQIYVPGYYRQMEVQVTRVQPKD